jgi:hypothetical protein
MRLAGLIAPSEPFVNGRRRRYSPKPSMREAFRECYRIELKSISLMEKRAQPLLDDYDNPDVFDGLIGFLAERLLLASKLDDEMLVPLGGVGRRSMGLLATYALAAEAFKAGRARRRCCRDQPVEYGAPPGCFTSPRPARADYSGTVRGKTRYKENWALCAHAGIRRCL